METVIFHGRGPLNVEISAGPVFSDQSYFAEKVRPIKSRPVISSAAPAPWQPVVNRVARGKFLGLANTGDANTRNGRRSMRIGNATTTAVGVDSVSVGTPASASAGNGIANGRNTTVMNNTFGLGLNSTIAIGSKSKASPSGVAIGDQVSAGAGGKVEPGYGVAVGFQSNAADERANAVGAQTNALGAGSTAVGRFGNARGEDSIVLVRQTTASGKNGIGIGFLPTAEDAYAVGLNSRAQAAGSIAIGSGSIVGASANANDANEAVVIGKGAKALHAWLAAQSSKVVDGGATAEAIDYSLKCCTALMRRFDDPALPIDNNHDEQQIRTDFAKGPSRVCLLPPYSSSMPSAVHLVHLLKGRAYAPSLSNVPQATCTVD
ncbi:IS66 family transposase [Variovorax sp. RB2P76]